MADKKLKPVIEILTGSLISGNRSTIFGIPTSPKTPSESKPQSPKFEIGAVGLSIVAALEKSGELPANKALFSRNLTRSILMPAKNCLRSSEEMELERLEEYTIVTTRHGPNKSHTKVYGSDLRVRNSKNIPSVFHISPIGITETAAVPPSDFLSSCNLCHKKLHDKDIYMYRGEKAFCSTECRYRQIMMDERTEKRNLEASIRLPVEVTSSSPYANSQIYSNGILAI